ncbi:serine/threonine-protein kinase [Streptomyces sp. LaPpAH-108]|uniref:serine/threonine-protein kinase n=1 Tax=Streptomyces sp. LaPpAH-108 TaxID=1155714 RepID=UPI0003AA57C5|nr:serine/threonine-protein kinase [Streptomyces sp. LaPpAH-108]
MQPLEADEPAAVGPYRLLGRLGSGGMGRVYLGRSAGGRTVAVKIVHPHFALDEEFRARFRREVAAARRVGGAWTAPVLDADPDAPVPWVATAYAAGPSLAAAVTERGPLPEPTVRALGAGLAEALAAVHALDLVHRDVKPSNILLTIDGPLLIDFGIARATDGTASLTSTGVSIGSPGYMAPEQILGTPVTGAADVFSLGAVLAYAATGTAPFASDSAAALLYKVVHEEPELDGLSGDLRELVAACLAKDPASRPTPAELSRRLAPEGAAPLMASGWLPAPLLEQVSRSAVGLLNLEGTPERPSGPVPFTNPAVEPAEQTVGAGEFGPAPVMRAPGAEQAPADTPPPPSAPPDPPGRLTLSVAAASTPGESGRGRRVSCTVAVAVAAALVGVTVGLGWLLGPWGGDGGHDTAGGKPTSSDGSAAEPSKSPSPGPTGSGAVPDRYLGTWEGEATGLGGTLPMGTFRLTVHQAAVGKELGRMRQTDQLGAVCVDVLTLKQVTKSKLVLTSTGADDNHAGCNPAPHPVELTPTGDKLTYTSDSSAEGNPVARLSRAD